MLRANKHHINNRTYSVPPVIAAWINSDILPLVSQNNLNQSIPDTLKLLVSFAAQRQRNELVTPIYAASDQALIDSWIMSGDHVAYLSQIMSAAKPLQVVRTIK